MKTHKLKLNIQFCNDVSSGTKSFEVRYNDREFQTSDSIRFIPVDDENNIVYHPIEKEEFKITYILSGWGLQNGYVVLAIEKLPIF